MCVSSSSWVYSTRSPALFFVSPDVAKTLVLFTAFPITLPVASESHSPSKNPLSFVFLCWRILGPCGHEFRSERSRNNRYCHRAEHLAATALKFESHSCRCAILRLRTVDGRDVGATVRRGRVFTAAAVRRWGPNGIVGSCAVCVCENNNENNTERDCKVTEFVKFSFCFHVLRIPTAAAALPHSTALTETAPPRNPLQCAILNNLSAGKYKES